MQKNVKALPLNILLADGDYRQYQLMKEALSIGNGFRARILWCGEQDQYLHAIQSGIYDLVFMAYEEECLFILHQLESGGFHTPVIMMADDPAENLRTKVCKSGALDLLSRSAPDQKLLKYYALYADMHRKGVLCLDSFKRMDTTFRVGLHNH